MLTADRIRLLEDLADDAKQKVANQAAADAAAQRAAADRGRKVPVPNKGTSHPVAKLLLKVGKFISKRNIQKAGGRTFAHDVGILHKQYGAPKF